MPKGWSLEIVPQTGQRIDQRLGVVEIKHAQSIVMYASEQLKRVNKAGKVEIAFLPDAFDVVHKMPHTDGLGTVRVAEIMEELRTMTGRDLSWVEHYSPLVKVGKEEIEDLDEAEEPEEIIDLDAVRQGPFDGMLPE